MDNKTKKHFNTEASRLFYGTTILGLLLIILNIYCDFSWLANIEESNYSAKWFLTLLSKTSSAVGVALLLVNLTKLFGKRDEENKAKERKEELLSTLTQVVVSKDNLSTLSIDDKKKIITQLISPENNSLSKHSDIEAYLSKKSDDYIRFFKKNFRSHMSIDVDVSFDGNKKVYMAKYRMSYRIYKINESYEPIYLYSEKEHELTKTEILAQDGSVLSKLKKEDFIEENGKYKYNIPSEYNQYSFLKIKRVIIEYGHPHWITINWKSLTPIDGIKFSVTCSKCKGIIKEYNIFDNEDLYQKPELSENMTELFIESNQWLDPYTGLFILVANKSEDDSFDKA